MPIRRRPCPSAVAACCSRIGRSARRAGGCRGASWSRRIGRAPAPCAAAATAVPRLGLKAALGGRSAADATAFLDAIDRADLVVVNGAGVITDAFRENALGILTTLDLATRRGIPTALLGQGLGPIEDPVLGSGRQRCFLTSGIIGVRESRTSVPLSSPWGCARKSVCDWRRRGGAGVFGMAWRGLTGCSSGVPKIGVNVRVAGYAAVASGNAVRPACSADRGGGRPRRAG